MRRVRKLGDLTLEPLYRLAEDESLLLDDFGHRIDDRIADGRVLRLEIKKWYRHSEWVLAGKWYCHLSAVSKQ